jgi:hypothetical protein
LATQQVVDTVATIDAVNRLMKRTTSSSFSVTLTEISAGTSFLVKISASGTFTVDWGDGTTVETITKSDTTNTSYYHTYASAGNYVIQFSGTATGYNTSNSIAAISFANATYRTKMTQIAGSLGAIFPTIDTVSPRFYYTFQGCTGLTSLPAELFSGITGAPVQSMFNNTFMGCTGLTGPIPAELFSGITGAPAPQMFNSTFSNCKGLTSIPAGLFAGLSGDAAPYMFQYTFSKCTGLTTLPSGLFAGISGAPAAYMFNGTFANCTGLTGTIPAGLFAGITGAPAEYMFRGTFDKCTGLTSLPSGLFSGINGAPATRTFDETFNGCTGLTGSIPSGLFGTFTGAPVAYMFDSTFYGCTGLTTIEDGIWDVSEVTNTNITGMFSNMFTGCTNITSASPNIAPGSSVRLYEKFTAVASPVWPFSGCTNMSDYDAMPVAWKWLEL